MNIDLPTPVLAAASVVWMGTRAHTMTSVQPPTSLATFDVSDSIVLTILYYMLDSKYMHGRTPLRFLQISSFGQAQSCS